MSEDDIPLFPVAGWSIGPIPRYGAVTIKLDFLTGPMHPLSEASPGRHYVLTAAQATEMAQRILGAVQQLEKSGEQAPPGPQH